MANDLFPVKATANADFTELMKMIYQDAAHPACKKIGQTLGTVFGLANTILLPFKLLNERSRMYMQHNLDDYAKKLESIPKDKIETVPPELGLPILDKFTYLDEGDIRDMFMRLLVSASNKDNTSSVHPSALKIIEMLSSDEAKMLMYLKDTVEIPFIYFDFPLKSGVGSITPALYLTGIESNVKLDYPINIPLYFDNLIGIGIIRNVQGRMIVTQDKYSELEKLYNEVIVKQKDIIKDSEKVDSSQMRIERGVLQITEVGKRFIKTCCLE